MDPEFLELEVQAIAKSLEPTPEQKQGARRSQRAIREALDTGNMSARIVGDYLIGSYARQTAITPLDDVDIMFLIDPTEWETPLLSDMPDPQKVLDTFARAIRMRYDQSRVALKRRSVGLTMHHLHIDAVPAIPTDREHFVLIPDRQEEEWILTAPRVHAQIVTDINRARAGMFVPLVKMLKGWNAGLSKTVRLKSFTIETMALRIFEATNFDSIFDGCLQFFDFLAGQFNEDTEYEWTDDFGVSLAWHNLGYHLEDVAGTGSNLLVKLSEDRRTAFLQAALAARNLMVKASRARSDDACERYLENVFG